MILEFILKGNVPPKKNLLYKGKYGNFYRPDNVVDFEKSSFIELVQQKGQYQDIHFPIVPQEISLEFYQKRIKDIDNLLGSIFDSLQNAQIIENDRLIHTLHVKRFASSEERTIIKISV